MLPAGDGIGEGLELIHGAVHVVDVVEVDDEGAGLGQHLPALRQVRLRRDAGGAEEALHDAVPREGVLAQEALLPPPRHLRELSPVESLHQVEVQLSQLQDGRIDGDLLVMVVVLDERPHGLQPRSSLQCNGNDGRWVQSDSSSRPAASLPTANALAWSSTVSPGKARYEAWYTASSASLSVILSPSSLNAPISMSVIAVVVKFSITKTG